MCWAVLLCVASMRELMVSLEWFGCQILIDLCSLTSFGLLVNQCLCQFSGEGSGGLSLFEQILRKGGTGWFDSARKLFYVCLFCWSRYVSNCETGL